MLNAIIRFSVRNKLIIGILTVVWIVWGILELLKLPIDALPDITSNQVQVITTTPALASPEVERIITFPIEQACSNIQGIKEIRSISRFGLSVVTVVFSDGTDIYWARQQVQERLVRVRDDIPKDAGIPELAPLTTGLGEIYQYVLKPKKGYEQQYGLDDLRSIQDWVVRRQLMGTPGVADVSSFGGFLKQYEVAVNTQRLKSMGLTIADVFNALEKNNQNSGGAYIEKGNEMLFIRTEGLTSSIEDIERIRIKTTTDGIPVYIGTIAEVKIGKAVRYGAMTYGSENEVAGAVVLMLKGENASNVVSEVKKRIEKIRSTLPQGVELITFYDRTKIVDRAIDTVKANLLEGALIVIFILVFFLGNLRASFIVASVIPLSMLFAVGMMNLFGVSGNLMSLGALDFGLIVDGAVIIVEAVIYRLYHSKMYSGFLSREDLDNAVETSSSRMMNAAVFGQAIILIVYLPILSLSGIEGKMFRPMAQTVIFALLGAFILSLSYVPMVTSLMLHKKVQVRESITDRFMEKVKRVYGSLLERSFRFPKSIMLGSVVLFFIAALVASRLGGEFIPKLEEGDFAVDARILTGSSLTATVHNSLEAAKILKKFPEVENIVTRIGSSEIPTDPMPVEMTDIMIILKDKKTWKTAESFEELADTMSKALQQIPGMTSGFQFPIQMRFNELVAGARQDVVCKIFGENIDTLAAYAGKLGSLAKGIEGASDIYVEAVTGLPQIVVRYKRDVLTMYGLDIADVNRTIRTAFAGESAGKIYENERRYDLVVRLSDQFRTDIEDIRQLMLPTNTGEQVPLVAVADIQIEQGPNQIQREDAKRRIMVGFNTRGRDVETVVAELQQKINKKLSLPSGYYVEFGGQFENLVEAKKRLSIAVPIALALIFAMLYFAFGSLKYGILIFSAIPLSAIGGVLSLWLRDMPFSISAGVGFIALFGVAVLNGIVLITEFNRLKADGITDVKKIIKEGTALRLRPVLMTAAVASFGFLPMALSQAAGAEVQRPLATVVIGGLITATILTLIVLPILYYWFNGGRRSSKLKALLVVGLFLSLDTTAQERLEPKGKSLPLDTLIAVSMRKNLSLEAARRMQDKWDVLEKQVFEFPKTGIGIEYGNINSFNRDTRAYISQSFLMPEVYKSRKAYYAAERKLGQIDVQLQELEIKRRVRYTYFQMEDLLRRLSLIDLLDSVYSGFIKAAGLRYKTGESPLLEQTAAEAEYARLHLSRTRLLADLDILQEKLGLLLHTNDKFLPMPGQDLKRVHLGMSNGLHPTIAFWQNRQQIYASEKRQEKATLLPDVTLGYNNLSLIGWQSSDGVTQKYYKGNERFNTINLGIGVSIFNSAAKARMEAAEKNIQAAKLKERQAQEEWQNQYTALSVEMKKHTASLDHYIKIALPQSELIQQKAIQAYKAGEIGYTEWINLMKQVVDIRNGFNDAILDLMMTITELEYLNLN